MKKRERILIITDSVSMPRLEVKYEETWIYFLKKKFKGLDIIDRPARGATSMRLIQEGGGGIDLLELYLPGIIILQFGLAECAPRLFKKNGFEKEFINKYLPSRLRKSYIKRIKRTRGRNPQFTDVPLEQFKYNIYNFAERCKAHNIRLAIIKILRPTELFLKKSPYIKQNIDRYNSVYEQASMDFDNVSIIDPIDMKLDINSLCLDELHINSRGHKLFFRAVEKYLAKNI
jgi:lysophospholipase L1-like esterase